LEWLWRIKEEPHLWKRYWRDGLALGCLAIRNVLPLTVLNRYLRIRAKARPAPFHMDLRVTGGRLEVVLGGDATEKSARCAAERLKKTLKPESYSVEIELSGVRAIDQRFLGLLLMLRRAASQQGATFTCVGASRSVRRLFRLNCCEDLLGDGISTAGKSNKVIFQS
jgi:N-acetylglucosaminyldiphosphoundecaprenol N-acetyl-beta-D-mannosaminyltransferase